MNTLITITEKYLEYCKSQKRLDYKTIKAYRIDLKQFTSFCNNTDIHTLSAADIENFIGYLHQNFILPVPLASYPANDICSLISLAGIKYSAKVTQ